ncbi:U6 snRNA phosphodiesterase [Ophiocordyceps camponoti-floridani]|uniref:U6 snRNA phosphodiesterase n=1 Tax=Ophiocordyceps camponoti-floridani TaxID=2030778 RepID=A0A8H4VFA5_9HYPO|nr:U6 snRNA phosphodiesterase [Ophiocordyceps camponoti-floridani]
MALVDYSSSSSSSEAGDAHAPKRLKSQQDTKALAMPPLPAAFHDLYASTVRHSVVDDPCLHQGRKRQTPHIPGCWPSHIYVEWHPTPQQHGTLSKLLSMVEAEMGRGFELHRFLTSDLGAPLPLHISLSRPLSLRSADKDAFLDRLTQSIQTSGLGTFSVAPCGLAWYKSPDSDRTFFILRVAAAPKSNNPQLTTLLERSNATANLYGQPTLYQKTRGEAVDMAFHVSIAWSFGLPGDEASVETLKLFQHNDLTDLSKMRIDVTAVKAKIGNVVTHIPLAQHGNQPDGTGLALA